MAEEEGAGGSYAGTYEEPQEAEAKDETWQDEQGTGGGYAPAETKKERVNTTVSPEVVAQAKAKGINLSSTLEKALKAAMAGGEKVVEATRREAKVEYRAGRGRRTRIARYRMPRIATGNPAMTTGEVSPYTPQVAIEPPNIMNNINPYAFTTLQRGYTNPMLLPINPFQGKQLVVAQPTHMLNLGAAKPSVNPLLPKPTGISLSRPKAAVPKNIFGIGKTKGGFKWR